MTRISSLRLAFAATLATSTAFAQVAWTQVANAGAPDPYCGYAWDSLRNRLVAYGGEVAGQQVATMKEWNGSQWVTINPAVRPSARSRPAMAFDEARGVTVLFGGGNTFSNETWTWNGSAWTQQSPANVPPPRFGAALAYDRQREVVVLFGGFVSTGQDANDVWEWNGGNWLPRPAIGAAPVGRGAHRMVYDDARRVVVMCGGYRTPIAQTLADTWTWNGSAWTQVANVPGGSVCDQYFAYDPTRQRAILFGGLRITGPTGPGNFVDLSAVHEWNGTSWTTRTVTSPLSARNGGANAWDPVNRRMLAAGGTAATVAAPPAATWAYAPVSGASVSSFGSPCLTSTGPLDLVEESLPYVGLPFVERIVGASPTAVVGLVLFGASNTNWNGLPLPLDLTVLGAPGCELLVSLDFLSTVPLVAGSGTTTWNLPNQASAIGLQFFTQGAALDPGSPLPFQVDMSSARSFSIGAP